MVNANVARHLLLVVSILLCFFVYMGYRIWGQPEGETPDGLVTPLDLADLNPGNTGRDPSSLMTVNDSPPASPGTVRAPIATPSGTPSSFGGREEIPSLPPPPSGGGLKPPSGGPSMPPPPSGSIEESTAPRNAVGAITGLVPAPSAKAPEGDNATSAESSKTSTTPAPTTPLRPGAAGGGRKPPGETASSAPRLMPQGSQSTTERAPDFRSTPASESNGFLAPPPPSGPGLTPPSTTPGRTGAASPGARTPVPDPTRPGQGPLPSRATGTPDRPGAASGSESLRVYIIQPGDTLSRIAARELGSTSLANNIFLLNRDVISDPNQLLVGERILLPVREGAVGSRATAPGVVGPGGPGRTPPAAPTGAVVRVHRVARGDTLSSIALRYYGSSAAWRFLYDSNKDVIANPNQLSIGTELVVPPYGERR